MIPLRDKHRRFANEYFKTQNGTQSYLKVYKCDPNAAKSGASRLLKNVNVRKYLAQMEEAATREVVEQKVISENEILQEETKLALQNLTAVLDENGQMLAFGDWPADIRAAIRSIKFTDDMAGNRVISEVQFYDKGQALNRLEKCYGMQVEKREVTGQLDIRAVLASIDGKNRGKLPQE